MRFELVTIFPEFFAGVFGHGIVRRAQAEGRLAIGVHDLRAFTHDRHRTVDDRPFGGGEGMVLKPEPLARAMESLGIAAKEQRGGEPGTRVILTVGAGAAVQPGDGAGAGGAGARGADLRAIRRSGRTDQ